LFSLSPTHLKKMLKDYSYCKTEAQNSFGRGIDPVPARRLPSSDTPSSSSYGSSPSILHPVHSHGGRYQLTYLLIEMIDQRLATVSTAYQAQGCHCHSRLRNDVPIRTDIVGTQASGVVVNAVCPLEQYQPLSQQSHLIRCHSMTDEFLTCPCYPTLIGEDGVDVGPCDNPRVGGVYFGRECLTYLLLRTHHVARDHVLISHFITVSPGTNISVTFSMSRSRTCISSGRCAFTRSCVASNNSVRLVISNVQEEDTTRCYWRTRRGGNPYFVYRVELWESFVDVEIPDTHCPKYCSHWIVEEVHSVSFSPKPQTTHPRPLDTVILSDPFKRRDQPS
jgi:hypothetical protein